MRLIDADAFRMELDNHWPFTKEEQSKHGIADMAKSTLLEVLYNMPTIEQPTVAYICDKTKCGEKCSAMEGICNHTFDIRHAVNFIEIHGVYVEDGESE